MPAKLRIGMVVDPVGSYGRGVIRGISAYANNRPDWSIAIEPRWSFDAPLSARDWDVDGMLVQVYSREFEEQVLARSFPVVNVANFFASRTPTVIPDDAAIGRMAADYFLSKGFRRLGFYGPTDLEYPRLRLPAFTKRAKEGGATVESCDSRNDDAEKWIRRMPTPFAVMGANDDWAHRLLNLCKRTGINVPDDVAIIGVDDDELINSLVSPTLSSVPVPAVQVGFEAARLLDQLMTGTENTPANAPTSLPLLTPAPSSARFPTPPPRILIPPTANVVTRQSTDVLAVEDTEVAAAVKYIRDRVGSHGAPTDVDDVLDEVALSRRSLERRFKATLGRGVAAEIRRVRLARARQLLAETDLSMPIVADRSGFGSATRLGIVFRQIEKMTPTRYRQFARGLESPNAATAE